MPPKLPLLSRLTATAWAAALLCLPLSARGEAANAYDLAGKALAPLAAVFVPQENPPTLAATLVVESMTGLPPQYAGARIEAAFQPPERARVKIAWEGGEITVGRDGQTLWAEPATLLPAPPPSKPRKKKEERLPPMALPFPPQQLALLPVLLQIQDRGVFDGLRVLDARLMPELARGLDAEAWAARLWIDPAAPEAPRIARLEVARPGWRLAVRVERLGPEHGLPASTWQPATEGALRLTGREARAWLDSLPWSQNAEKP